MPRFSKKPKQVILSPTAHTVAGMKFTSHQIRALTDWDKHTCNDCVEAQSDRDAKAIAELVLTKLPSRTADVLLSELLGFVANDNFHSASVKKLAAKLAPQIGWH